jgi:four helix bundle protein
MTQFSNKFDLAERTTVFSEQLIKVCQSLVENAINKPIINQLIRSGTSIGANYSEANNASSKKDFQNKIFICKKESQETKYWLRILAGCSPDKLSELRVLWKEVHELTMIFQKIINSLRQKN